jgi:hypothetical protein
LSAEEQKEVQCLDRMFKGYAYNLAAQKRKFSQFAPKARQPTATCRHRCISPRKEEGLAVHVNDL